MALDLWDPRTYEHGAPYEEYRRLRDEQPVFRAPHPVWEDGYWVVSRHADVQRVSRDSDTFSNSPNPFLPDDSGAIGDDGTSELLISLDPPRHTRMRKLINRGFTPRRVADLTAGIQSQVDRLIDSVADRNECDMVSDIAVELPLQVIADLVGVPEEDRHKIFHWTEMSFGFDPSVTPEQRGEAAVNMYMYADQMVEIRKTEKHDDLISVLMEGEVDGERLTQMQIDVFFLLLQNAGSETTRNLITTGTLALLQHPEQLERLRNDLSLLPNAIEELLRYATPVVQFTRHATKDTEIAGQRIAAGEHVAMQYVAANRDERAFEDPDTLDITRDVSQHVAFGAGGPHFCLGASLARLEARIMFEAIITRFEGLEVTEDPATLPRVHSNLIDGFARMPIRWDRIR
jgi:cholest-4-en-3-one 26-monooxygenase